MASGFGTWMRNAMCALAAAVLSGCGGGGGGTTANYAISGTVSGLLGSGLVLELNGSEFPVAADGTFSFPAITDGSDYHVTIKTQPAQPTQSCTIAQNTGRLAGADVTDVEVTCPEVWHRAKQLGVANTGTIGRATATDAQGNVYVAGYTGGGLDGSPVPATNYFFAKYSPLGALSYTRQKGGAAGTVTQGTSMAVDANGNVYVAGYTSGNLGGTQYGTHGAQDYFVAKYDASGTLVYVAQHGSASVRTVGLGITADANGNAYVVGYTFGALTGSRQGTVDLFLVKHDIGGAPVYIKQVGGASNTSSEARDVAVDSSGRAYVIAKTTGSLDGTALRGNQDYVILKFDTDGSPLGTWQFGYPLASIDPSHIRLDSSNNIVVSGDLIGDLSAATPHSGNRDAFLVRHDATVARTLAKQWGLSGHSVYAYGLALDTSGNFYLAGSTNGALGAMPQTGTEDLFLTKLDSSGTPLFTRQLGVAGAKAHGNSVALSGTSIYVAGYTEGGLDGNTLTGNGDAYVIKYDDAGVRQ